jgi:Ca-activated chloride channel homolog
VAPPRSPEGTSVILIVDKSSSMEGRKMELARVAAIGVVDNLRPIDYIGVLIFDNSHEWAVPLRRAEDQMLIKRLIAGIMPDGGTQIAPALTEAYNRMQRATGAYKHIVLLTDGIAEEGNSMEIANAAAQSKVTISTVGLGQDVNRAYLQKVADLAKGKAYFVINPEELAQILIRDVMEHTGSTTVEKPIQAIVKRQAELFQGLDLARAPELKGYVRFEAKPQADTLLALVSTPDEEDPLLSRWQYGLGRAAVFTSDAKARWAEAWVGWAGYPKFWTNLVRDLLPNAQSGEATLTHDPTQGELLAEYRLAAHVEAPAEPPALYALGPDGFQRTITAERAGDGYYRARVPIGARQGLFRVRPLEESRAFPEAGLYLPEPELSTFGNNPQLLAQIAAYTGGQVNPEPRDIFNPGGRTVPASLRLWPGLIGLALLLNFLELAWRKLRRT